MERRAGTVSAIKALGYPGVSCLSKCKCDELPCPLLTWLSAQLRRLCPELQGDSGGRGDVLLVEELRHLLSDLSSPLTVPTSEVLGPPTLNKVTEFLVSELQAARIFKHHELHPEDKTTGGESEKEQRVDDHSHELAEEYEDEGSDSDRRKAEMQAEWILLLHALNMDASSQFTDVMKEVESRLASQSCGHMTDPLLNNSLSPEQWAQLVKINEVLSNNYNCRRQMMIKRFQVTLESFAWGEKQKERSEALASVPPLASFSGSSRVSMSLLLAAREDQSCIEPIRAGKSTDVYKTRMGDVPDRGGRPGEIEPPMPSWGERRTQGNRSGRGRGQQQWRKFSDKKKKKGKKE
ncbi:protein FAM98B isoform X1 [Scomber scombrus]|uniref:protein FAM98B isoform X1 n=1 Tax=Scomber scombrus TaxID=13677 RepID=UPI002DDC8DEB|nr:protein FAM98B isoform X1 [Scomber scombrus]